MEEREGSRAMECRQPIEAGSKEEIDLLLESALPTP